MYGWKTKSSRQNWTASLFWEAVPPCVSNRTSIHQTQKKTIKMFYTSVDCWGFFLSVWLAKGSIDKK